MTPVSYCKKKSSEQCEELSDLLRWTFAVVPSSLLTVRLIPDPVTSREQLPIRDLVFGPSFTWFDPNHQVSMEVFMLGTIELLAVALFCMLHKDLNKCFIGI